MESANDEFAVQGQSHGVVVKQEIQDLQAPAVNNAPTVPRATRSSAREPKGKEVVTASVQGCPQKKKKKAALSCEASTSRAMARKKGRPLKVGPLYGERLISRLIYKVVGDVTRSLVIPDSIRVHIRSSIPAKVRIGCPGGLVYAVDMVKEVDCVRTGLGWEDFAKEFEISPGDVLLITVFAKDTWGVSVFGENGREKFAKDTWGVSVFGGNGRENVRP